MERSWEVWLWLSRMVDGARKKGLGKDGLVGDEV
jgi:hypothetical protein